MLLCGYAGLGESERRGFREGAQALANRGDGAIEQLLSGWVFGLMPATDEEFDRARAMVVETLCLGLERRDRG